MGNKNKSSRPKKRKFQGNRHSKTEPVQPDIDLESGSPILDGTADEDNSALDLDLCASAKKIRAANCSEVDQSDLTPQGGFILIDSAILFEFLSSNMRCGECGHYSVKTGFKANSKSGFSHEIEAKCENCSKWSAGFKTSRASSKSGHSEINLRMVSYVRSLGRGFSALQNFSLYVNSPPPMTKNNYKKIFRTVHSASKEVALESMKSAAEELRGAGGQIEEDVDLDTVDRAVSVDGTWQRRGFASHHGVVTALSVESGKCLDVEVLSNICKGCQFWDGKEGTEEHERWSLTHQCKMNHKGSAGAMEAIGAARIFLRSEESRKLRYTQYLGDGDSASFKKVSDQKPYGEDVEIEKLECVGHVQKRCGTRLRRLINDNKGKKLDDGKGLGGAGRLTKKKIDTLQNYFGFSIRQNSSNLEKMRADVMAVLYHVASTDENSQHHLCPSDSWCKYKMDPDTYKHKHGLPTSVVKFIKPVFEDLSDEKLLRKCLHGKTQNVNECLNKLIWDRCSKEYYVEKDTVEEAVYSAVAYFNDGASAVVKLCECLGIQGHYTLRASHAKDSDRIAKSSYKSKDNTKQRRKTLRAIKKGFQDKAEATEGDMYSNGGH